MGVDPYLFPARGRKLTAHTVRLDNSDVDPYLFPARGRKRGDYCELKYAVCEVDPYLFPARGRKHQTCHCPIRLGKS